jgi:hypothetical protein
MNVFVATALLLLALPGCAWAWGPVTHLWHGAEVLSDLTNVGRGLQQLLGQCRWAYLYGCVAADIVQAKRFTESVYTHCHSWRIGWRLLEGARGDEERAFGWGYLSHLAADVYSHNDFVPEHLVTSFPSLTRRHIYWEARFDAQFGTVERRLLEEVLSRRSRAGERLIERTVGRTLLPFRANKRIFDSYVSLQHLDRWQDVLRRVTARSRFGLPADEIERYNRSCVAAIRDLLVHGEKARVVRHDPNGHEMLRRAKEVRRKLWTLRRLGVSPTALKRQLNEMLERPDLEAPVPEVPRARPSRAAAHTRRDA